MRRGFSKWYVAAEAAGNGWGHTPTKVMAGSTKASITPLIGGSMSTSSGLFLRDGKCTMFAITRDASIQNIFVLSHRQSTDENTWGRVTQARSIAIKHTALGDTPTT